MTFDVSEFRSFVHANRVAGAVRGAPVGGVGGLWVGLFNVGD